MNGIGESNSFSGRKNVVWMGEAGDPTIKKEAQKLATNVMQSKYKSIFNGEN